MVVGRNKVMPAEDQHSAWCVVRTQSSPLLQWDIAVLLREKTHIMAFLCPPLLWVVSDTPLGLDPRTLRL